MEYSVLMSLYKNEKSKNLGECLDSILRQSVLPTEVVIVKDGPLTEDLELVLKEYVNKDPDLYKVIPLEKNVGLGLALAEGIKHCNNNLVARMDTDDICVPNRFEKQLKEFEKNPELDICGSHIVEFEKTPSEPVAMRKVPLTDLEIRKYQKRRSAFNHMTVMYKKEKVLESGNYQHALLMEDDLLWVNMLKAGAKAGNIDEVLVYARTGDGMYERRGGWQYFRKYCEGRKQIYQTGYISKWDYWYTIIVQFIVALVPLNMRKFIFNKLLRK